MDIKTNLLFVLVLFVLTVMLNLPCGYWRRRQKRYSFNWFLFIHLPVPFIIAARYFFSLDVSYIPLFLIAALIGQIWGGKIEL